MFILGAVFVCCIRTLYVDALLNRESLLELEIETHELPTLAWLKAPSSNYVWILYMSVWRL